MSEATTSPSKPRLRNYDHSDARASVREHYRKMRSRQTHAFGRRMREKYLRFDRPMAVWDAIVKLDELVDVSDPDISLSNVQHLVQTAEGVGADGRPDWMELVGLLHDLGKILFVWECDEDGTSEREQWGLVGDVFATGCRLPETCVYPELNALNPDMDDDRYNTELGVYEPGCGLDQLQLAWGHDEYLYRVLSHHPGNRLPEQAMVQIRYHSFYPWHTGGSYRALLRHEDERYRDWVLDFNRYDLYTKSSQTYDLAEVRSEYLPLIERYLGPDPVMW